MSTTAVTASYRPSRFVSMNFEDDGSLVVHSSKTGAIGVVPPADAETARRALLPNTRLTPPFEGILGDLVTGGFLIPDTVDERQHVLDSYVSRYARKSLGLIVLPTEQCNFRCVYCYESFLRGKMTPELQEGLLRFVKDHDDLQSLTLSWFGGEPLLAADIVERLTRDLREHCERKDIEFSSGATTNGSLLTPETADRIIGAGVTSFQITLDGLECDHDRRRVGTDGSPTFSRILENLVAMRDSDHEFSVMLRHNFDPESLPSLPKYLEFIKDHFGGDERFSTHFEAIGKWGGPNDDGLTVCEGRDAPRAIAQATRMALDAGFPNKTLSNVLQPEGYVCYAADPNSFVVGSDGLLYKCTVELDYHDRNIVGRLHPDGTMDLDWRKMGLWCETNGQDEGKKCNGCWFGPSCHGAVCPKEWMDEQDCFCPPAKQTIRETLSIVRLAGGSGLLQDADGPQCPKG